MSLIIRDGTSAANLAKVDPSGNQWVYIGGGTLAVVGTVAYGSPATPVVQVEVVNPTTATFTETEIGVTQITSPWLVGTTQLPSALDGSGNLMVATQASSYVPATINTGQVLVDSTAPQIVAQNTSRQGVLITNVGPNAVYLGASGVDITTGAYLGSGSSATLPTTAEIYGVTAPDLPQTVTYMELV